MKVKKSTKKVSPPPSDAARYIEQITQAADDDLVSVLSSLQVWRYPRGDLHAWVDILDRFDTLLESAVKDYDLSKLQTNDFTPQTKALILEILRVTKILFESCTNRKLYNSYDRLNDLLLTNDIDILHATINLLVRPLQQYASLTPFDKPTSRSISARLNILARGSEILRLHGFDLKALASDDILSTTDDVNQLQISFYPTQVETDKSPKIGPSTLTMNVAEAPEVLIQDKVLALAEEKHMSVDDSLDTLSKARWILSVKDAQLRHKLLATRLLAISGLWYLNADTASSNIFLYEPGFLAQLVALLGEGIDDSIQAAAILAFDGCTRHRSKLQELVTILGANLSHGPLMSLFRRTINRLVASDPSLSHDVVDALFGLLGYIANTPPFSQVLLGAGVMPILLEACKTTNLRRDSYVPRATGLIDAFTHGHTNFSEHINVLVALVKDEVQNHLDAILPEPTETLSQDTITYYTALPLRSILRSLYRVMHSGAEGSRNLVDSDVPKSIKVIFENADKFGPRVFAQAINIMASFVHNEPTSLAILQEQQLPQTLFARVEQQVPDFFDVISALTSAIGASCLNSSGLDYMAAHPTIIRKLVIASSDLTDENGADQIHHIGAHLDELARHHPPLKQMIFDCAKDVLLARTDQTVTFEPSEEQKPDYDWHTIEKPTKVATNDRLKSINKIVRLWGGLLQNSAFAKEFVEKCFDPLIEIGDLNCIPVSFSGNELRVSLMRIFRLLSDREPKAVIRHLVKQIEEAMSRVKPFWDAEDPAILDNWQAIHEHREDETLAKAFKALPGLNLRVVFLTDLIAGIAFAHARTLTHTLEDAQGIIKLVEPLSRLHRNTLRAHAQFAEEPTSLTASPNAMAGLEEHVEKGDKWPRTGAQFMSSRLYMALTKYFKGTIKLLHYRKGPDNAHRKAANGYAKLLAGEIASCLQTVTSPASTSMSIGLATLLLFEERGHEGQLNTTLFVSFTLNDGVEKLVKACEQVVDRMDTRTEETSERTLAALRTVLCSLGALIMPGQVVDSHQTQAVSAGSVNFSASDLLVRNRLLITPLLHRIWTASWLDTCPVSITKTVARAMLAVMDSKAEEVRTAPTRGILGAITTPVPIVAAENPRPPPTADPARVQQLVDMGFSRTASEFALLRARNNVAAATEFILMMPHLLPQEPDPVPEPAATSAEAPADGAQPGNETTGDGQAPVEGAQTADASTQTEIPPVTQPAEAAVAGPSTIAVTVTTDVVMSSEDPAPSTAEAGTAMAVDDASGPAGDASAAEDNVQAPDVDPSAPRAESPTPPLDVDIKATDQEEIRSRLNALREQYKDGISPRALELLDIADELVFDLIPAFPPGMPGVSILMDHAIAGTQIEGDKRDDVINSRLRMLSVFLHGTQEEITLDAKCQQQAVAIISPLQLEGSPRPKWLPSLLFFAESIFSASELIASAKIGEEPKDALRPMDELDAAVPDLTISINMVLSDNEATRDEMISALRLMLVLTRREQDIAPLQTLLEPFKKPEAKLSRLQAYIAMIFRHVFEDEEALQTAMRREIRHYLGRSKVPDISHFVNKLAFASCRNAEIFVRAVQKECTLLDPSPSQSVYHVRALEQAPAPPTDVFQATGDDSSTAPIMDMLVEELATLPTAAPAYASLIAALLTELLGSYTSTKRLFANSLRKRNSKSGLAFIVNDLVCKVNLTDLDLNHDWKSPDEGTQRWMLSSWTTSMLIALLADPGTDMKEDAEILTSVRKNLLEVVAKAIKESPALDANAYYGRLWALGELVQRLLEPQSGGSPRLDPSTTQVAKIMLEKNFVGILTAAAGEVDLNFPNVRLVLGSLLKALDHLTKVSIKWSKTEKSKVEAVPEDDESSSSLDDEDDEMDMDSEGEQQAPDLYRNSALGMLDMMDEDSDMEEDEDEDDDEMMEAFDDEMEVMDDESGTEPSDEDNDTDDDGAEWTDEDMEGDEEGDDDDEDDHLPQVVIGDPDPAIAEEWEEDSEGDEGPITMGRGEGLLDMAMEGLEDMEEEGMFDMEEMDGMEEDEEDGEMDMEEYDDDIDQEEEEYLEEEVAFIGRRPPVHSQSVGNAHWTWGQSAEGSRPRSSRRGGPYDAAAQLLGISTRAGQGGSDLPSLFAPVNSGLLPSRPGAPGSTRRELLSALEGMGGPDAVRLLEALLRRSEMTGGDAAIRVNLAHTEDGMLDVSIGGRSFSVPHQLPRTEPNEEDLITESEPRPTADRWSEEMRLSPNQPRDYQVQVVHHLINRLLPDAKKRAEEEAAKRKKQEEERAAEDAKKKQEEAAKKAEEDAKKAEEDAKTAEDEKTRVDQAATAATNALPASHASPGPPVLATEVPTADPSGDVEMGEPESSTTVPAGPGAATVEVDGTANAEGSGQPAAPETLARTIVQVHGEDVDITDAGIDLEFLQALPDDMRADVIEQHLREQNRARQPSAPDVPPEATGISPEFLNALPPDIRAEVIMQQAMEREHRQRASAPLNVEQNANARPALPPAADFLSHLSDELRDVIGVPGRTVRPAKPAKKVEDVEKVPRESVQLLEKPGIAALTRLLFFPEAFKKDRLFRILTHLCENSTTRSDLLNLLLSVVQDGSGDLPTVDRSFQQMSLKAMATTTPKSTSKAKAAESPAPFASTNLFAHLQTDNIPTFIAQRCLEALTHILSHNAQSVNFFLTEHEQGVGLKKVSKKGKGKEKVLPQIKFPIVILLGLLDRPNLLTAPGLLESLTALLATVTRPLSTIKAEIDKAEEAKAKSEKPDEGKAESDAAKPPGGAVKSGKSEDKEAGSSSKAKEKSTALPRFPLIPAAVLKLVVNCLTTGECSSKNFSQTLIVIQNLSCIPEARTVILQELQDRSQKLGQDIQQELGQLSSALEDPSFETSHPALMVFSSPSSNQAQLLRLLKTIEYLHLSKVDSDAPGDVMSDKEKAVSATYGSFDFEPMWNGLQGCLTQVEDRADTEQIALVLLPLVESLMVVCKYRREVREVRSPSLPPSSAVDNSDLFLSFTTHHRKVLNSIVRNNPALLSGSFSLLIHNPRVLEFDNKRQWFFQKLRRKKDQPIPSVPIHLNIRRQYVFQDSFDALRHRTGDEVKYGKIGVKFIHEDGIDAGGVTREWYSVLAKQIFDPNFALFEPCAADQQTYQPNKYSSVNGEHMSYFKFIGRIIGKAVYDGRLLDAYFNRAFYKQILGKTVDMRDLESIDPEYHKSLQWMLENDITGVIDQEFTIEDDQFGEKKIVELKENGASIPVTEENKEEYVRLVVSYRLDNSIKEQIKAFLDGFYSIIPRSLIQIFDPDQLELLISGLSKVDVDELKNATQMSGYKSSDPEIGWFWRALRSFSQEERSRFLMFVTSSSRVPIGGFTQLQGASGTQPFQIQKLYAKEGSLPQASTCFNLLLLPKYASYEQLRERLQFAVTETGGFGKA